MVGPPTASAFVYSKLTDLDNAYSRVDPLARRRAPILDTITTLLTQSEPQRVPYGSLSRDGRWIMLGLTDGWSQNDLWIGRTSRIGEGDR